jgi:hypothetical protein
VDAGDLQWPVVLSFPADRGTMIPPRAARRGHRRHAGDARDVAEPRALQLRQV